MLDRINILKIIKDHLGTLRSLNQSSNRIYWKDFLLFFIFPVIVSTLLVWKGYSFKEQLGNLIAAISIFGGFLFTTFCTRLLVNTFASIPLWVDILFFISFIIYLVMALSHFYESSWKRALLKGTFISLSFLFLFLPLTIAGIVLVSFLLY